MCSRAQTDQTTTLCVQEVEIYLERWEVLGALVDVSVGRRKVTFSFLLSYTNINKGAQHYYKSYIQIQHFLHYT